jgi:Dienelactone hydrolase family
VRRSTALSLELAHQADAAQRVQHVGWLAHEAHFSADYTNGATARGLDRRKKSCGRRGKAYYGVGLDNLVGGLGSVKKPLVLHIADKDEFFPAEGRAKVVEAVKGHRQVAAYVYPDADHAFARLGGTHWDGRSATIANGRSAEALVAALG